MKFKIRKYNLIFILWILLPFFASAQSKLVSGIVLDQSNLKPIPFANIAVKKTLTGTISKINGQFELPIKQFPQTIIFSTVGYYSDTVYVELPLDSMIILLKPREFQINEIVIKAGENPANRIIRNIIANKEKNNPLQFERYQCNTYTKILVSAVNETSNDFFADDELPVYFSEKLSKNYYQKSPFLTEGIVLDEKQTGLGFLKEMSIVGYENNMSLEYNFYDNVIELFDKPFVSPLNSRPFLYYKFYLKDSLTTKHGKEYLLEFQPKNKNDLAFKGILHVLDETWQLTEISASIPLDANLNYVNKLHFKHTFQPVNDSLMFFKLNEVNAELKITKDNDWVDMAFAARLDKQTIYSDIQLDVHNFDSIEINQESRQNQKLNLLKSRPSPLSEGELEAIQKIDSLNNLWQVRSVDALSKMFITGYFPGDYFDFGPYLELLKYNKVEGYRFSVAARTSTDFTHNLMLYGHAGYGTRDQKWKYGAGAKYKLPLKNRSIVSIEYRNDMTKIGDNGSIFLIKENMMVTAEDNLIASIFTNSALDKLGIEERYKLTLEHEWRDGLNSFFEANYRNVYSGMFIPFYKDEQAVDFINIRELKFGMRWSWHEKYTDNYCRRFYMGTQYPIVNLRITGGQFQIEENTDEFLKLRAVVNHDINFGQTKLEYVWEAGTVIGNVPFPLLDIQRTDQSLGYALYSFNMMDEMEFAADKFTSLMAQYHLNGTLLNRVPLLSRLSFREVFSAKMLMSSLSDAHQSTLSYPIPFKAANKPYVELSAGLENIFKYFRFDLIWRVNYNNSNENIPLGIRARFDVSF